MAVTQQDLRRLWAAYRDASKRLAQARATGAPADVEARLVAETNAALTAWGEAKDGFFAAMGSGQPPHDWLIEAEAGKAVVVMKPKGSGLYDEYHRYNCPQCGASTEVPAGYQQPAGNCPPPQKKT